jgi:non-heme chloroperoxidase
MSTSRTPVLFIHGLWLLESSWAPWGKVFSEANYAPIMAGWPDDPATVEDANANPQVLAGKSIGEVADHYADVVRALGVKPVIVGHSFGGLLAQILAGRGLAAATVAIAPAGFRGVLPLPYSALKSASPVLSNPLNRSRAVPLTFDQFRYAFANAVPQEEAQALYDEHAVPAAGKPLFQAAAANLNPWTEAKVDSETAARGPLLMVAGAVDHTVPPAVVRAAYEIQRRNSGVTEFVEMPGRGHALTIDHGWKEVAALSLDFLQRTLQRKRTVEAGSEAGQ